MKKLLFISALCLSMTAHAELPKSVHYFKNNTVQVESDTMNLDVNNKLSDMDFDFKVSMTTHFNNNFYSTVSVTKYEKDQVGYGAVIGVEEPYKDVTAYSEVTYNHDYTDVKNLSDKQFNYDSGVRLNILSSLSPYIECDDYADSDLFFLKAGLRYTINKKFFLVADYSFKSKVTGNKVGLGMGLKL